MPTRGILVSLGRGGCQDIHDYGGDEHLLKGFLPSYLSKGDEYHYEIIKDVKFIDLIKDLAVYGYKYTEKNNSDCLATKVMKTVDYHVVPFVKNKIEDFFRNDDLKSFKELEIINKNDVNWNNKNFFLLGEKHKSEKILNYLFENGYQISKENIKSFIMNDWFVFNSGIKNYILNKSQNKEYIEEYNVYSFQFFQDDIKNKKYNEALTWLKVHNEFQESEQNNVSSNFVSLDLLKFNEKEVLPIYVKFFQKRNKIVESFILYELEDMTGILKYKEIREAISLDYIMKVFKERQDKALENITQHKSSRLEMVMIDYSGNRTTRSQELSGKYNDLAFLKNKILAYFSGSNDTDDKPKYRTKF